MKACTCGLPPLDCQCPGPGAEAIAKAKRELAKLRAEEASGDTWNWPSFIAAAVVPNPMGGYVAAASPIIAAAIAVSPEGGTWPEIARSAVRGAEAVYDELLKRGHVRDV